MTIQTMGAAHVYISYSIRSFKEIIKSAIKFLYTSKKKFGYVYIPQKYSGLFIRDGVEIESLPLEILKDLKEYSRIFYFVSQQLQINNRRLLNFKKDLNSTMFTNHLEINKKGKIDEVLLGMRFGELLERHQSVAGKYGSFIDVAKLLKPITAYNGNFIGYSGIELTTGVWDNREVNRDCDFNAGKIHWVKKSVIGDQTLINNCVQEINNLIDEIEDVKILLDEGVNIKQYPELDWLIKRFPSYLDGVSFFSPTYESRNTDICSILQKRLCKLKVALLKMSLYL